MSIDVVDREVIARYQIPRSVLVNWYKQQFAHVLGDPVLYGSGYYSYQWAVVLEADAFTAFKGDGVLSAEVGGRFRRETLEKGGTEDTGVIFRAFMGRDPDPTALFTRNTFLTTRRA
jgi:oligopeptidase A